MEYTITNDPKVEKEYCDEWETIMQIGLRRDDGAEGVVWVAAGVPDYHRGSAQSAGHNMGFEDVRPCDFGSLDAWCDRALYEGCAEHGADGDRDELITTMIETVRKAAMAAHREYQSGTA